MTTFIVKQRSVLGSFFSFGLPRSFRKKILKSPLSSFEVAPKEVFNEVKREHDSFIQNKAFANAVARIGTANRFRGTNRIMKKKVTIVSRGMRARGQIFRGFNAGRGNRVQFRGSLRGVRRASISGRNMRGYARRDRAIKEAENQTKGNASTVTAGFSYENQL